MTTVAACTPATEVAQLGVYHGDANAGEDDASVCDDAGVCDDAAVGDDTDVSSDDTSLPRPVPIADAGMGAIGDAVFGPGLPPCLRDGCISKNGNSYADWGVRCFSLLARAAGALDMRYVVPEEPDHYVTFTLRNPEPSARFIRSIEATIDDPRFLHDMKLYAHDGVLPEGVAVGRATANGLRLVYSWWPLAKPFALDESVGVPMDPNTFYTLEVHYNNEPAFGYGVSADASGLGLCVTSSQPSFAVSLSRLGSDSFMGSSAHGTCTPSNSQPIQLLAVWPRMNLYGANAKMVLHGSSGGISIYDQPFVYGNESLATLGPRSLAPGDTLTSTCTYSQSTQSGLGVHDEVCELYVLHWPAHTLTSVPDAPDTCMN